MTPPRPPESEAAVPEEFMRVQWTRLPGALPGLGFTAQVARLLDAPRKAAAAGRHEQIVVSGLGRRSARRRGPGRNRIHGFPASQTEPP